jgi:repressor LexA
MKKRVIPIVGEIACGTPITAEENIEGYADLPSGVHADFALRCKGDSMAPTFENNDLVLIRQQPDVLDGQIAAVDVACEATLKHVYHQASGLLLVSDNPAYPPISVSASEEIIIHGLAVGYVRMFKR